MLLGLTRLVKFKAKGGWAKFLIAVLFSERDPCFSRVYVADYRIALVSDDRDSNYRQRPTAGRLEPFPNSHTYSMVRPKRNLLTQKLAKRVSPIIKFRRAVREEYVPGLYWSSVL
jgi:hypothetical protein